MSKSFWIQVLSVAALVMNSLAGSMIPPEVITFIVAGINLFLFILKDGKIADLNKQILDKECD